jgi:hypothetical protein
MPVLSLSLQCADARHKALLPRHKVLTHPAQQMPPYLECSAI